jgi:hypothetical protein
MAIRDQGELYNFLLPYLFGAPELEQVVASAVFRDGRCLGLNYGPLKRTLSFGQFEILLKELNVSILIGARRDGDQVCPDSYPTGNTSKPWCKPQDNSFCNITGLGGTLGDCP